MQRRTLLKLGAGSAVALAIAGGGIAMLQPGVRDARLTASGRRIFAALAPAVLEGHLPAAEAERQQAVAATLERLDATIAGFPPATRDELSDLLALLDTAPGRLLVAGLRPAWEQATVAQLQAALQDMRLSSITLRQQAYHALRELTIAAYYGDPATWRALGHQAPPLAA